ncbi:MAG: Fe-S cluster assembly protein SufD [Candidatus Pelagibacter bacterium]|nr:Fe-S cluster assembly protein SufD [Candidatus Pelagibacter bacterium]MBL6860908.1 Fe-S cluster assembly protein SufD [Candidatus Pelagibacter bacterium]
MQQFYDFKINKIKNLSSEEKILRKKNLELFYLNGFPSKKDEDWKFTDLNFILGQNFTNIVNTELIPDEKPFNPINEFEHNFIYLVNGKLISKNFDHEEKDKILISNFDYKNEIILYRENTLNFLNNALAKDGFSLEISKNYKFKKPLVIYNYFSNSLKETIVNNKNLIILNENSELTLINFVDNNSKENFIINTIDDIKLKKNSSLKSIFINNSKNNAYFYKYLKNDLEKNSNLENYILSSGLKLNKFDIEVNHNAEYSSSNIFSALNLSNYEHQEIKTLINHNTPNCQSYQKIKNVLNNESKGVFQGKIFVKNIAQKTDAYQLSRALILDDKAEFNAKPELEIYADDVKCSHGSTSGSIDLESIHYLKSRGIPEKEAYQMLINGFLCEVLEKLNENNLKKFLLKKLESQIHGY